MTGLCRVCRYGLPESVVPVLCCPGCQAWIEGRLADVVALWRQLPDYLERGRGHSGPRVSGNTRTGSPTPGTEDVLDLIGPGGVHDILIPHLADIREVRGLPKLDIKGGADHRLTAAVRGLRAHLPWAVQAYDLHALAVELRGLVGRMQHATGDRPEKDENTATIGPCQVERVDNDGETRPCGGTLRYDRAARTLCCDTCGLNDPAARHTSLAGKS